MIIGQPVTVRPIGGALVKKPNGAILSAGGEIVTASTYWRRRVVDGSVEEVGAGEVRPGPVGQKLVVIYACLADCPTASEFGDGIAIISPISRSFNIERRSNSQEWYSFGNSTLLADRPAAVDFGIGEWTVNGFVKYRSNGIKWIFEFNGLTTTLTASRNFTALDNGLIIPNTTPNDLTGTIAENMDDGFGIILLRASSGNVTLAAGANVEFIKDGLGVASISTTNYGHGISALWMAANTYKVWVL